MDQFALDKAQASTRWLLAYVYVPFGIFHILAPEKFLPIVPPAVPEPLLVVMATGLCEVLGGVGVLLPWTRRTAGILLALYALSVWPANIYHAVAQVHLPPLPDSWWYHGPRLAFQPVMIWAPLFAAGLTGWPFRRTKTRADHASRRMRS
jgi:uncharacterized membrane protein